MYFYYLFDTMPFLYQNNIYERWNAISFNANTNRTVDLEYPSYDNKRSNGHIVNMVTAY